MRKFRIAASLLTVATLSASAHAQQMFFDDFESGLANWTATGLWRSLGATSTCGAPLAPFPSGSACAWFGAEAPSGGVPCSFDDRTDPIFGPSGTLSLTTPVLLSGTGRFAWLRYENRIQSEGCSWSLQGGMWDVPVRDVSIDGGASWISLDADCVGSTWHKGRADLTPYLGEQVLVRFEFDAFDVTMNGGFGWLIDDVELRIEPGKPACDASAACPCGNYTPPPHPFSPVVEDLDNLNIGGCQNSFQATPELWGSGVANMSEDTAILHAEGMPPGTTALVFQGSASASPTPLADGTTCVSGTLVRLGLQTTATGAIQHPTAGGLPLSATAVVHQSRFYQVYYRNAAAYCTPATFNTTNSYGIPWGP